MIWYEFMRDNGDGSYSSMRFKTREEAQEALDFLETTKYFTSDGDGVNKVDTDSGWFWSTLEEIKEDYS